MLVNFAFGGAVRPDCIWHAVKPNVEANPFAFAGLTISKGADLLVLALNNFANACGDLGDPCKKKESVFHRL